MLSFNVYGTEQTNEVMDKMEARIKKHETEKDGCVTMKETNFKVCEKIKVFTYYFALLTYCFAWLTFVIFVFTHQNNPELYTRSMGCYFLLTPSGMAWYSVILEENLNEIKDAYERFKQRVFHIFVVVFTLLWTYIPWEYFITRLFC